MKMNNIDPPILGLEISRCLLNTSLDGADSVVRIPQGSVYPIDVEDRLGEKYTLPADEDQWLEWFGGQGSPGRGYILVPDAPGALIYLNNGRINTSVL